MITTSLSIDQAKLFEACNHDARLMAIMLTVTELVTGDRVEVNFAHPTTNSAVKLYQSQLRQAIGLPT